MSGSLHAWYSLRDLEALGQRHATLDGEIELSKLIRLAGLLHDSSGSVKASLRAQQRGEGWLALQLQYDATVQLLCQRCLEPLAEHLAGQVEIAVVETAGSAVPEGYEPVELERGRLKPAELIEDELIVALPLVPKHARVEDCGSLARVLTPGP